MKRVSDLSAIGIGALPVLLSAAVLAAILPGQRREQTADAIEARALDLSMSVATLASNASPADLDQHFKALGTVDPEILHLVVLSASGERLAAYKGQSAAALGAQSYKDRATQRRTASWVQSSSPIEVRSGDRASAVVQISLASAQAAYRSCLQSIALWSSLLALFFGALVLLGARRLFRPFRHAGVTVANAATTLEKASQAQSSAATEDAEVVEETRYAMSTLLDSAQQIASQSREVLSTAERTASSTKEIAEHLDELDRSGEKVAEILSSIMRIADRADLLALNAALEGTHAGEAGRGFALLAAEMRSLAESIMEAVGMIRALVLEMNTTSRGAAEASGVGKTSSQETAASARRIAMLTQMQRQATETVMASMDIMKDTLMERIRSGDSTANTVVKDLFALSDILDQAGDPTALLDAVDTDEATT